MNNRLKPLIILIVLGFQGLSVLAQDVWDLKRCVEYGIANNISLKQADITARVSSLFYTQGRASQLPSLNFNTSTGYNFGRSVDPTTNQFSNTRLLFSSYGMQTGMDIFNWFSKKYSIENSKFTLEANEANVEKLKSDLVLDIAASYLQVLLSLEQVKASKIQVNDTKLQFANTQKLVEAGSLPELNAAELEAQLARDSSNLITLETSVQQNILLLKALMNLDAGQELLLEVPRVESIPVESIAELSPDFVYGLALKNLPQQRVNDLRILAAQSQVKSSKGSMYPSISFFGSLQSNYSSLAREFVSSTQTGTETIGTVVVNNTTHNVVRPTFDFNFNDIPYFNQLDRNFRQTAGLSLVVPMFNGLNSKTTYERSKLDLKGVELQKDADNQRLKQDIYRAYNDARAALLQYQASVKTLETAQKAFSYAEKRYALNMLNATEYLTNQNNVFRSRIDMNRAQFDYVFKMKVLEFYKGQGIKL